MLDVMTLFMFVIILKMLLIKIISGCSPKLISLITHKWNIKSAMFRLQSRTSHKDGLLLPHSTNAASI
jgi:hypothetical protein